MKTLKDCSGVPYPVYAVGRVSMCSTVDGAKPDGSVFSLKVELSENFAQKPVAGQFYMLRAIKTKLLLGRPISVFHCEETKHGIELEFLILKKGLGTTELTSLEADDEIQLLGPLGNVFPTPKADTKVCIASGGIGIAPVAGFSESLTPGTYDFYASFKSGKYGVDKLRPQKLTITTDDGSCGEKGMISCVLNAETLKKGGYSAIYACGPAPMLSYIKEIAKEASIQCWLSMEAHMACGVGVCLGCTIPTTQGNKRCCKDGPVFDADELIFKAAPVAEKRIQLSKKPDMSVYIKNVKLENPIIASSGTFGFGTEYKSVFDVNNLGAISSKGLTLEPRQGNSGIRLWETPSGLLNSIGLQNPGIPHFIENELEDMLKLKPVTIANLAGSTMESYVEGAKLLDKTSVPVIELNISCPNVATGGAAWGMACNTAYEITKAVKQVTTKPLIVKLTPQAPEYIKVAMNCIQAGADAISMCNSFQGVAVDIETGHPIFDKVKAGFGGPAVHPIAVRLIYEIYEEILKLSEDQRVPLIAIGGVSEWQDVVEFIMCGASAVSIGTNTFANPFTMIECIEGLSRFMIRKGYEKIEDFRGIAHKK